MEPSDTGFADAPATRVPLPSSAFTDRVMAALVDVPAPSPTRSFVLALRRGTLRNAARSLSVASHLVTVRTWPIPPRVRARSFALVLGVAFLLGTGSVAAAAAVHVIVPMRLTGPADIDAGGSDPESQATERPAASAPTGVGAGPVSIEPSGDTAAPKASKTHVAGQAGPHQAVPAVDKEGDADADHDGSRGMAGSGGSGDDDDADRGGSHVDASDDGVHELGHDGSVDSDGGDSGG